MTDALTLLTKMWSTGIAPADYPKVIALVRALDGPAPGGGVRPSAPAPVATAAPVRRGPGRPPGSKSQPAPKRKPGRPPKLKSMAAAPSNLGVELARVALENGPKTAEDLTTVAGISGYVAVAQLGAKKAGLDEQGRTLYRLPTTIAQDEAPGL